MLKRSWNTAWNGDIEFDDIMHQNHGRLNIALPIMLGNSLIGPTLMKFHNLYPHVTVNMMEEVNFVAEHTLTDHTVDLTFYNVHEFPHRFGLSDYWKRRNGAGVIF